MVPSHNTSPACCSGLFPASSSDPCVSAFGRMEFSPKDFIGLIYLLVAMESTIEIDPSLSLSGWTTRSCAENIDQGREKKTG